jgi:hypothetical protein
VAPVGDFLQLAMLEELRTPEPPIRLSALFFEPGTADQLAAELAALEEVVVAVAAPRESRAGRACDELLFAKGVAAASPDPQAERLYERLAHLGLFVADGDAAEGPVGEGAHHAARLFETNADGIFCALQGRRLPAKRHPYGMRLRIGELSDDHVLDQGGELWHRRIEEVDAAGAALCAHRYAVGHACWLGRPGDAVVVLPGSALPERFATEGVIPPVERLQLPPAD